MSGRRSPLHRFVQVRSLDRVCQQKTPVRSLASYEVEVAMMTPCPFVILTILALFTIPSIASVAVTEKDCIGLELMGCIDFSDYSYLPRFCPDDRQNNKTHELLYTCFNELYLKCTDVNQTFHCDPPSQDHGLEVMCINATTMDPVKVKGSSYVLEIALPLLSMVVIVVVLGIIICWRKRRSRKEGDYKRTETSDTSPKLKSEQLGTP